MTEREEQAVIVLNTLYNNPLLSDIHRQALEVGIMAIKAESSSEKSNKWIGADVLNHWIGADDVLDRIRNEIEYLPKTYPFVNHYDMYVKEDDVKKIIDKYKAESEEQNDD